MKTDNDYLLSYHMDDKIVTMCMSQRQEASLISAFLAKVRKEFDARFKPESSKRDLIPFETNLRNLMKDFNSGNNKLLVADDEIRKLEKEVIETQSTCGSPRKSHRQNRRFEPARPQDRRHGNAGLYSVHRRCGCEKRAMVATRQELRLRCWVRGKPVLT